jgi:hypothetical protein
VRSQISRPDSSSKEAVWLRLLLKELNPVDQTSYSTIIYCNNQDTISLTKNPKFYLRTKYIAIQYYWVRKKIAEQEVDLQYIETNRQIVDGLTKALPKDTFEVFRMALGLEGTVQVS